MEDDTPWWFGLSEADIEAELAEEARQNAHAEEAYQALLRQPDAWSGRTDEF